MIGIVAASCTPKQTDMQIRLTGNVDCASKPRVLIRVGNEANIETHPSQVVASDHCDEDGLGTLTILPEDDESETIAINVVMAVGRDPASCVVGDSANCWLQRRVIPFIKGQQFNLPINFILSCVTNLCTPGTTCSVGSVCVRAVVDAAQCLVSACFPAGFPSEAKVIGPDDSATPLGDGQMSRDGEIQQTDGMTTEDASSDGSSSMDAADDGMTTVEAGKDGGVIDVSDGAIIIDMK